MSTRQVFYRQGIPNRDGQSGQTTIFVVLVLGLFLLAMVGLAVDYSSVYFHRQAAQGAADAACQAGAMDMLVLAEGESVPAPGFNVGSSFDCVASPNAVPCRYAAINGYNGTGLVADTESNSVAVSFPPTVDGVTAPPVSVAGPFPFMRVDVTDRTRMYFSSILTAQRTKDVGAYAVCGLQEAKAPIPIIVLHPSCPHSFQVSGSATLQIVGGPSKSVQVNSGNPTCAAATQNTQCGGNGTIDLSLGGPSYSGSNFGVWGAPGMAPPNFNGGTTGTWISPATPISDPFANVPAPAIPAAAPPKVSACALSSACLQGSTPGAYQYHGCPDHSGCDVYQPGLYTQPIVIKGVTAIFEPGIYYIAPTSYTGDATGGTYCASPGTGCGTQGTGQCRAALVVASNGIVRPSSQAGTDGSYGVMFYLSGNSTPGYGSVVMTSNAGNPGGRTVDPYVVSNMACPGGGMPPSELALPSQVDGDVLLGPCTTKGTYIGAPGETVGPGRGLLFFQDHANGDPSGQPNMQGGGGLLLSGTMYFHNTDYQSFFQLQGTPGPGTYVLGEIVTDQLVEAGNGSVKMQLSPYAILEILKVALLK